ncbi:unnamed protein product, partial [marine sediment metagenome]
MNQGIVLNGIIVVISLFEVGKDYKVKATVKKHEM